MARLVAALLTIASAVCLYFALTTPIVVSRMITLTEMIKVLYPMEAYAQGIPEGQPAATPEGYDKAVQNYEKLISNFVLKTDVAKANFAALTQPTGRTAWGSARLLWDAGDKLSSTAIVGFSIVYPIVKTIIVLFLIITNVRAGPAFRIAEWTHKYTMLDVFVAAVTLVAFSSQKLIEINTGPAVLWYVAYLACGFTALGILIMAKPKAAAPA